MVLSRTGVLIDAPSGPLLTISGHTTPPSHAPMRSSSDRAAFLAGGGAAPAAPAAPAPEPGWVGWSTMRLVPRPIVPRSCTGAELLLGCGKDGVGGAGVWPGSPPVSCRSAAYASGIWGEGGDPWAMTPHNPAVSLWRR